MNKLNCPLLQHRLLGVLRIVLAFLFIQHGSAKLLGFPFVEKFATLQVMSLSSIAGVLELVGGALLLVDLFTRPVAFVLSGLMAFAYFIAHASKDFWTLLNGGELAVLYCFAFLYLAAAGGGAFSLDGQKKPSAQEAAPSE